MPARRLPWIKFWPELLEHRKFGELTDAESWTWVVVWGKASQQPDRWQFASLDHAARATGRPSKQIRRLVEVCLIDADTAGRLTIHDFKQWQDRFPSDDPANAPPSNGEHSANDPPILPPTPNEDSPEDSANTVSNTPNSLQKKREERVKTGDVDERTKNYDAADAASPGGIGGRNGVVLSPEDQALHERYLTEERQRQPRQLKNILKTGDAGAVGR